MRWAADLREPVEVLRVRLQRDPSGYPPFESEELSGQRLEEHLFELLTAPAFAFGLARGDVVRARHFPEMRGLWLDEFVSAGRHSNVRAITLGGRVSDEPRLIAVRHGGVVSQTPVEGLIAIDVPPDADFRAMFEELRAGRVAGEWDIEVGVMSAVHATQMDGLPLD